MKKIQLDRPQQAVLAWALLPVWAIWLLNGFYTDSLGKANIWLYWLADLCQWIVLPVLLLLALKHHAALWPKHYGFDLAEMRWQSSVFETLLVFATTAAAFFVVERISWQMLEHPSGVFSYHGVFPGGLIGAALRVYASVTAGIVESIFFIGLPWLLHQGLRIKPSKLLFIAVVAPLFGLAHWEQGAHVAIGAFVSQLVVCLWYFKLRTLFPVAAAHMLVDLVAFS